jgi:prepilin-type processing-associated H-X9-DG protein
MPMNRPFLIASGWLVSFVLAVAVVLAAQQLTASRAELEQARLGTHPPLADRATPDQSSREEYPAERIDALRTQVAETKRDVQRLQASMAGSQTPELRAAIARYEEIYREHQQLAQRDDIVQIEGLAERKQLREIATAILRFVREHNGVFPTQFVEFQNYLTPEFYISLDLQRYELLPVENAAQISDPARTIVLRTRSPDDRNRRAFLFADGHAEVRMETVEGTP